MTAAAARWIVTAAIITLRKQIASLGERSFENLDRAKRQLGELFQRWDNRLKWPLKVLEDYRRGALCIVVKFNAVSGRDIRDIDKIGAAAHEGISRHADGWYADRVEDREIRGHCSFDHERQNGVLIRYVQLVEGIKSVALSPWEDFERDEKVFYPFTGCFYSFAAGFVINPAIARGEYEVAVLRAAVQSDRLPRHVIESRANVVDSIAHYEGEMLGWITHESNSNLGLSGIGVVVDRESVRFSGDVCRKFGFKISDVMVGPFDL